MNQFFTGGVKVHSWQWQYIIIPPRAVSLCLGIKGSSLPRRTTELIGQPSKPSRKKGQAAGYCVQDIFLMKVAQEILNVVPSFVMMRRIVNTLTNGTDPRVSRVPPKEISKLPGWYLVATQGKVQFTDNVNYIMDDSPAVVVQLTALQAMYDKIIFWLEYHYESEIDKWPIAENGWEEFK